MGACALACFIVQGATNANATLPTSPETQLAYLAAEDRVLLVDTVTGDRDELSGPTNGTGPAFVGSGEFVTDVLIEDANTLVVSAGDAIFRVDRTTGNRTELALTDAGTPNVTPATYLEMEWETATTIIFFAKDSIDQSFFGRIDLTAMTHAIILGSGPVPGNFAGDMVREDAGTMAVLDFSNRQVIRMDPVTGARTKLNASDLVFAATMTILPSDLFYMTEFDTNRDLYTYNGSTDTLVNTTHSLPTDVIPVAVDTYDDGTVLLYNGDDFNGTSLIRIDSSTGAQTTVAITGDSGGPDLPTASYFDRGGLLLLDAGSSASSVSNWIRY